jgi:hypothetical protein
MMAGVTTTAKKLTVLAVVAAAFALPAAAQAATITFTTPFQADVQACNGDTIHLDGQLLGTFSATFNSAGGIMFASHTQPQGIAGTDLQTGTKYLGTGVTRDVVTVAPSGTNTISFVNRFHIQATAGADSFDISETFHITTLADGTVTAFVDNFSASC